MKIIPLTINSERLILRAFTLVDAEQYSKLSIHSINTITKAKNFIKSSWKKDSYYFGIFLKEYNLLIGQIELCHMNWWYDKAGEICYHIGKKYWGKGYATEASKAVISYCFSKLKFRKIYADTDPNNLASQKVLEKLGFKFEGRIREKNLIKGKWTDELDYGLLRSEWKR